MSAPTTEPKISVIDLFKSFGDLHVLVDVSLVIPTGQTTAIIGPSGAGKSTSFQLLLRFYDASEGRILVDGIDIRELTLTDLRRHIAMVGQDVVLFNDSIRNNIAYGVEREVDEEELRRVAQGAHALEFIERLPGGFDSVLRERGGGLSVGQKQLIAFARALAFGHEHGIVREIHRHPGTMFDTGRRIADDVVELVARLVDHLGDLLELEYVLGLCLGTRQLVERVAAVIADDRLLERDLAVHDIDDIEQHALLVAEQEVEVAQADIEIDDQGPVTAFGKTHREGGRRGRLANAPFSGSDCDNPAHNYPMDSRTSSSSSVTCVSFPRCCLSISSPSR